MAAGALPRFGAEDEELGVHPHVYVDEELPPRGEFPANCLANPPPRGPWASLAPRVTAPSLHGVAAKSWGTEPSTALPPTPGGPTRNMPKSQNKHGE